MEVARSLRRSQPGTSAEYSRPERSVGAPYSRPQFQPSAEALRIRRHLRSEPVSTGDTFGVYEDT
jgi:hypothetical protein